MEQTQPYHDPQDEPTAPPLDPSFFDFDNGVSLDKTQLKGTRTFSLCVIHGYCLFILTPISA